MTMQNESLSIDMLGPQSHNSTDYVQSREHGHVSINDLQVQIEKATALAVETEDYLSYATVLDLTLGNPFRFTVEEATELLATLHESLAAHPVVLYKVGWDFPELLLKYIDRFFVADVQNLPTQKPFRLVMSLFSLLCEKGNPKELLIRGCELLLSVEIERNSKRMARIKLNDDEEEEEKQQQAKLAASHPADIDQSHKGFDVWDDARQENIKFCTLFEMIRFSLQNIETSVPSSYLLEATRTLLQVADDPNADILSVSTYARRMFLLARDFSIKNESIVSPEEMLRVQKLLVNFITHTADVVLRKYTLKWAERLYIQMRKKVAMAPPSERSFVYSETEYTRRMSEVMSRMAQLLLSYDYEPRIKLAEILQIPECPLQPHEKMPNENLMDTKIEGAEVLADNYWSRQLLEGPSALGLTLLSTQLHFDGSRTKKPNFTMISNFSLRLRKFPTRSQGLKDMILYWALWLSNYFDSIFEEEDKVDSQLLTDWLQMLLSLISTSKSSEEQFVTGSIVARALRFQSPDFAYNFCVDIMKRSSSPAEQYVIVESMKTLVTGKILNPVDTEKSPSGQLCTQLSCCELTGDRRRELTQVSKDAILRLKRLNQALPWYYLNLLAVVPTDPKIMISLCDELDHISTQCETQANISKNCLAQLAMLRKATEQLRVRAQRELEA